MQYIPTFLRIQIGGMLAFVVVLYGLGDYLLLPSRQSYLETEQQLADLKKCADNLGANLMALKDSQAKFAEHRQHLDEAYDSMESESLDPLEWLHNVSERSGIKILSFQDQRHGIVNNLPAVNIDMKAQGTYIQICNFLHHLERSSRPCFVSHFHIQLQSNESNSLEIEAKILVFPISSEFQQLLQKPDTPSLASNSADSKHKLQTP